MDVGEIGPNMDLMRLQLTDLLVRRNLEEAGLQASKKAEASEVLLQREREVTLGVTRDLLQMKLMLAEVRGSGFSWTLSLTAK